MAVAFDKLASAYVGSSTSYVEFSSISQDYDTLYFIGALMRGTQYASNSIQNGLIRINGNNQDIYHSSFQKRQGWSSIVGGSQYSSTSGIPMGHITERYYGNYDSTGFTAMECYFFNYSESDKETSIIGHGGATTQWYQYSAWDYSYQEGGDGRTTPSAMTSFKYGHEQWGSYSWMAGCYFQLFGLKYD